MDRLTNQPGATGGRLQATSIKTIGNLWLPEIRQLENYAFPIAKTISAKKSVSY
ncbi:hypothetical protein [Sphingobium sp. B1D7B]|uniref:hypothetical protein n=1 Tax=Sphingobium sp. B1D7B TaxID=2940578 RepID=UPI002224AB64|nr:hypothetical protein [Sphingobium sp. B1D7B]